MGGIRILILVDHYHPGWKAGGPIRAIQHLVAHLGDTFSFDIVTSDRDLGERRGYAGIPTDSWQACGKARVLYLSPAGRDLVGWRTLLRASGDYDLVYLNSIFSRSTMRILALRRLGLLPALPYLLAPRGELQPGALSLKPHRKTLWLGLSRALRLYDGIEWQAATPSEQQDIRGALRAAEAPVHVASDVPARGAGRPGGGEGSGGGLDHAAVRSRAKQPGSARVVFISRISRKKNLDYALRVLSMVRGRVEFDIYGPIEDERYWRDCLKLVGHLPSRVAATYRGALPPDDVVRVFGEYDLFFLPTRGESFGHVVVESLLAGCPVLVSDQTPWRRLAECEAGWDLPLGQPAEFAATIDRVVEMNESALRTWSAGASRLARRPGDLADAVDANRRLFLGAASQPRQRFRISEAAATSPGDLRSGSGHCGN